MTYNQAGRLSSASVGGTTASYLYTAQGQLIRKSVGGVAPLFVYDEAGHLLGEFTATGALIEETVWLDDTPVATIRPSSTGAGINTFYVHTDQLNTPRSVTRPADNALLWSWPIDPFGTSAPNQNPQGQGTFVYNLRFPGQYYQAETGLNYNNFRDYDPQTGRYVESDPIGLQGGINSYGYVGANPISLMDPLGLYCLSDAAIDAIGGGVGGAITGLFFGGIPGLLFGGAAGAGGGYLAGTIEAGIANSSGTLLGEIAGGALSGAGSGAGDGLGGLVVGTMTGAYGGTVSGTVPTKSFGNSVVGGIANAVASGVAGGMRGVAAVGVAAGLGGAYVGAIGGGIGGIVGGGIIDVLKANNDCGCGK